MEASWKGKYWFLGNVPEYLKQRKTEFEMIVENHEGTKISGKIFDNIETGGTAGIGNFSGSIKHNKIEFIKRMPIRTLLFQDGTKTEEEKPHRKVYYKGIIDHSSGNVTGTWRFKIGIGFTKGKLVYYPGTKGAWELKTKPNNKQIP